MKNLISKSLNKKLRIAEVLFTIYVYLLAYFAIDPITMFVISEFFNAPGEVREHRILRAIVLMIVMFILSSFLAAINVMRQQIGSEEET